MNTKLKRFRQIPTWNPKAKFHLTGEEFLELKTFFDTYARPLFFMEQIFERHINSGTIEMKYEDEEGKEMTQNEIEEIMKEYEKLSAKDEKEEGV